MTGVEYICDCKHEVRVYTYMQLHPVKHYGCAELPQQLGGLNIHMHMYSLKKPGECLQNVCALGAGQMQVLASHSEPYLPRCELDTCMTFVAIHGTATAVAMHDTMDVHAITVYNP